MAPGNVPLAQVAGAAPHDAPPPPARLSSLERALHLFTDVHPGEGMTAVIMCANVFLILCAYYFVKPLRDGWIAVSGIEGFSPVEVKAYTSFAQGVVLIAVTAVYARIVTRWPRREVIARSTLFCMANLVAFWVLYQVRVAAAGVAFYIWVGMFGLFVVAQFWAFAADLYTDERGRRLMPMIALGATAGAVAGSFVTKAIVRSGLLDGSALLLAANLPLAASVALTAVADARGPTGERVPAPGPRPAAVLAATDGTHVGPLALVCRHRYLLGIAAITFLMHWVSTNGDNLLFRTVQDAIARDLAGRPGLDVRHMTALVREGTTAFYGGFFFWVNASALVLQAVFASRLLKYGGLGVILLLLPIITLFGAVTMAFVPLLLVVRVMKTAESSTSYSINNTAQQILWLPTTREMKYHAKPAIDTLCVRLGDGLAAVTVLIGVRFYGLPTQALFMFNAVLVVLWVVIGVAVVRAHHRLRAARGRTDRPVPAELPS